MVDDNIRDMTSELRVDRIHIVRPPSDDDLDTSPSDPTGRGGAVLGNYIR